MAKCLGTAFWSSGRCPFYFAHFLFPSFPLFFSPISILLWSDYYSLKRSSTQTGTMSYEIAENPILRIEMKIHLGLAGKKPQAFSLACIGVDDLWSFWENCCAKEVMPFDLLSPASVRPDSLSQKLAMKRSLLDVKSHVRLWLIAYAVRKLLLASNWTSFQERFGVGLVFFFFLRVRY